MSVLYAALQRGFDEGRAAAIHAAEEPMAHDGGGVRLATPAETATAAMSALAKVLQEAGCLQEPAPPAPEMTDTEAAELLCRLAQSRRLDASDQADVDSLVTSRAMFEYAWGCVQRAGINPADADRAHTAHRLLAAHHGLR